MGSGSLVRIFRFLEISIGRKMSRYFRFLINEDNFSRGVGYEVFGSIFWYYSVDKYLGGLW